MRSYFMFPFLLLALWCQSVPLYAQGVFVTRGENGPVFSDKPQPGAKEVALPPLNVMTPPPEVRSGAKPPPAAGEGSSAAAPAPAYRAFSIVAPENDGSVVANTAVFEVRLAVDPPLQLGERHAFMVSINGRPVAQRFTATEFMIPPEFWGDTLPPPNQRIQLDASVVDGEGQVLRQAAPVRFYMRHATLLNRPRPPLPPQVVPPPLPPKPMPRPSTTGLEAVPAGTPGGMGRADR